MELNFKKLIRQTLIFSLLVLIISYLKLIDLHQRYKRARKRDDSITAMMLLRKSIDEYFLDYNVFPSKSHGLHSLTMLPTSNDPYIQDIPYDAWGTKIRLQYIGTRQYPQLQSAGADKTFDTQDDIKFFAGGLATENIWKTYNKFRLINKAIYKYKQDCLRFPQEKQGLSELTEHLDTQRWNGPYYYDDLLDAWGTPIKYKLFEDSPIIISAGPDKRWDTRDDILSTHDITP